MAKCKLKFKAPTPPGSINFSVATLGITLIRLVSSPLLSAEAGCEIPSKANSHSAPTMCQVLQALRRQRKIPHNSLSQGFHRPR